MVDKDAPPEPIDIGSLPQKNTTFWSEGVEAVSATETTSSALARTEPTEASFVAFCHICERLLATLEPVGKGHFKNRETNLLVKKAFNDPTSLTPKQQERFVSALNRRLNDLSDEVADDFQKSEDHGLYTSVVNHFKHPDGPPSQTGEAGAATSPVHAETSTPRSDLEAAALQYKALVANPPGNAVLVLLGLVVGIGGPILAVFSVIDALFNSGVGDDAAIAFMCYGGIGLGVLLIAAGTAGSKSHEKTTNEAFQRMVSLSKTVNQEDSAPTKNTKWASIIGLIFIALVLGLSDIAFMLSIVVPLLFAEYFYHSDKRDKRNATEQAEMLIAIEQEINRD